MISPMLHGINDNHYGPSHFMPVYCALKDIWQSYVVELYFI